MSLIAKKQERAKVATDLQALTEKVGSENREWTSEENQRFDALEADFNRLDGEINKLERSAEIARKSAEASFQKAEEKGISPDEQRNHEEEYRDVFFRYLVTGERGLDNEEYKVLRSGKISPETRAQITTTNSLGGYLVPTTTANRIVEAMQKYDGVSSVATVFTTPDGGSYELATDNDVANEATIIAEDTAGSVTNITFDQVVFGSYLLHAPPVVASNSMLQDSVVRLEDHIVKKLAQRFGRGQATYFTTGNGTTEPEGIVTGAADSGITAASTTTVTYAELVSVMGALEPDYAENASWMFHNDMLTNLMKLVDSQGRPLWQFNARDGQPNTILGKPYTINQKMAAPATGVKSILFGDMSYFHIRMVEGIRITQDAIPSKDSVGFYGFKRVDSKLIDAGTNPIIYMDQA